MNNVHLVVRKLVISIALPLLIVSLGGLIVYQSASAFFYPIATENVSESNSPAVVYFALTFAVAVMFFLIRQGYKGYEFVAFGALAIIYSLSLQKMTPILHRPLYVFFLPLLVFFFLIWLVLKFIFLNPQFRSFRLILFALLSSAAFTLAFRLQFGMLGRLTNPNFLQARFFSGLMLFIFMGFGLSVTEFLLMRIEKKEIYGQIKSAVDHDNEKQDDAAGEK